MNKFMRYCILNMRPTIKKFEFYAKNKSKRYEANNDRDKKNVCVKDE